MFVELNVLRPGEARTDELLAKTTEALGWLVPLEVTMDNRVEIPFVGGNVDEDRRRVKAALDAAGEDWPDYFTFG